MATAHDDGLPRLGRANAAAMRGHGLFHTAVATRLRLACARWRPHVAKWEHGTRGRVRVLDKRLGRVFWSTPCSSRWLSPSTGITVYTHVDTYRGWGVDTARVVRRMSNSDRRAITRARAVAWVACRSAIRTWCGCDAPCVLSARAASGMVGATARGCDERPSRRASVLTSVCLDERPRRRDVRARARA